MKLYCKLWICSCIAAMGLCGACGVGKHSPLAGYIITALIWGFIPLVWCAIDST